MSLDGVVVLPELLGSVHTAPAGAGACSGLWRGRLGTRFPNSIQSQPNLLAPAMKGEATASLFIFHPHPILFSSLTLPSPSPPSHTKRNCRKKDQEHDRENPHFLSKKYDSRFMLYGAGSITMKSALQIIPLIIEATCFINTYMMPVDPHTPMR